MFQPILLSLFYDSIEFLAAIWLADQEENWYILIPFDVFSFRHVLFLPSLPSETTST